MFQTVLMDFVRSIRSNIQFSQNQLIILFIYFFNFPVVSTILHHCDTPRQSSCYSNSQHTKQVCALHPALDILYYTNIKQYIDQREFGSFNVNLSRANKCSVRVNFLSADLCSNGKMKLDCVKTSKN